ncbi:MAG TPA: c-type cytochrome, partial [Pyrinomonadaceae bacterium]|nr:c-type cytochrome [Pyrinomonadaceae bacterium]
RNCILLSIIVCLCTLSLTMVSRAERGGAGPLQTQGPQGDKPVDQTRKNIQVLKGLPEAQLTPLMNFVAVSLGVKCDFCHVQQGKDPKTGFINWLWERDDKPEKQAARRMMKMVLDINASNTVDFTKNSVTCYTCHRGQTATVRLPSMPLARSGHEPGPNDALPPATPPVRPSVDQIFAKYLDALGGAKAPATRTLGMKGRREASQNRNFPNEITFAAPDKFLVVVSTPQAVVRQSVSGEQGWALNGTNLRTFTTAEAVDVRRGWEDAFSVVKVKQVPGMNFGGVQKVSERETYLIAKSNDTKTELYYFDSTTGLLVRKMTISHTSLLPIPEQIDFEDYPDVDGIKMPFTIRYSGIDTFSSWTRTFSEIKRDVAVDENIFGKPAPPK